jgi:hypothetical protein
MPLGRSNHVRSLAVLDGAANLEDHIRPDTERLVKLLSAREMSQLFKNKARQIFAGLAKNTFDYVTRRFNASNQRPSCKIKLLAEFRFLVSKK